MNFYSYVGGNPLARLDPMGLASVTVAPYTVIPVPPGDWPCMDSMWGCVQPNVSMTAECDSCGFLHINVTLRPIIRVRDEERYDYESNLFAFAPRDPSVKGRKSAIDHEKRHIEDLRGWLTDFVEHWERHWGAACEAMKRYFEKKFNGRFNMFANTTQARRD